MLIYRIVHKQYSGELYASGMQGRWNGEGKKVIYCAESVALAFLENMVRRQGVGFNHDFRIMTIEVPEDLGITEVHEFDLVRGWRSFKDYSNCQVIGNNWFDERKTPVLKAPSAVLPANFNYVLNATHKDFARIRLLQTAALVPDERIEEILKSYRK